MYYNLLHQSHVETIPDSYRAAEPGFPSEHLEEAVFAGGSFWDLEAAFGLLDGVVKTGAGYCGGTVRKPSYKEVCEGNTGHTEAIKIIFDKQRISYKSLCDHFWEAHDPTDKEYLSFGAGTHHRSVIFYGNEDQRKQALESKVRRQMKLNKRIVTKIIPQESDFFLAENQHQKYYLQRDYIWVCESLHLRSTEQFVDSFIACKLNGILALDGTKAADSLKRFLNTHEVSEQKKLICQGILEDLGRKDLKLADI